jgi:hypothetical protein
MSPAVTVLLTTGLSLLAAIVTIGITAYFNSITERFKISVGYETRRKELLYSKLLEKRLAAYECITARIADVLQAVGVLVSPMKFVPQSDDINKSAQDHDRQLSRAAVAELIELHKELQHNRLYLEPDLYDTLINIRDSANRLISEYADNSVDFVGQPREKVAHFKSIQTKMTELADTNSRIIESIQAILNPKEPPSKHAWIVTFSRKPPFIIPRSINIPDFSESRV